MGHFPLHRVFDLASLRARYGGRRAEARATPVRHPLATIRARSVAIVSGKGGTGKSVVSASIARLLARAARTLLIDADLGVGNAHILQGVTPAGTLADLFCGRPARELVERCGGGLDLIAGGSGVARLARVSQSDIARLGDAICGLECSYDYLLADCGAGISEATLAFARAADRVVVVTTSDLTAMTDAYAFLKVIGIPSTGPAPALVVNRAPTEAAALQTAERVQSVARRFLGRAPTWLGWLPADPLVTDSVNAREPLIERTPTSPAGRALLSLFEDLKESLDSAHPAGLGLQLAARRAAVRA
jgi:flagellar biosynthesis protein FlhG